MAKITRLGQYRLLRKLGEGGMGAVFEAVQESLDRHVALKILPMKLTKNAEFVERFKREAKAAARLQHPHIVTVFDTGQDQGFYFYSMELVDGASLQAHVKQKGPLGIEESLGLMRQAIEGLAYAWEQNIIHRDIKPDNLMLTSRGVLKVADFGLAKARLETESLALTGSGSSMGTPYYMSPEQGVNAKDVDHRADIYSLGATFYHVLTGKVPFEGSSPIEVAIKVATAKFAPVREIRPDVPQGLAAVIERMLARQPAQRYHSAEELFSALDFVKQQVAAPAPAGPGLTASVPPTAPAAGSDARLEQLSRISAQPPPQAVAALPVERREKQQAEPPWWATVVGESAPVSRPAKPREEPRQKGETGKEQAPPSGTPPLVVAQAVATFRFHCPSCNAPHDVSEQHVGQKFNCHKCGQRLQVPAPKFTATIQPAESKTSLGKLPGQEEIVPMEVVEPCTPEILPADDPAEALPARPVHRAKRVSVDDPYRQAAFRKLMEELFVAGTPLSLGEKIKLPVHLSVWPGLCLLIAVLAGFGNKALGVAIPSLFLLILVIVGGILWAWKRWAAAVARQHEAVAELIATLNQEYADEVRLIGGRRVLEDRGRLDAVLQVLRETHQRPDRHLLGAAAGQTGGGMSSNATSPPPVEVVLTYPGKWFLFDWSWNVLLDGQAVGVATVKKGFTLRFRTVTGVHRLTLQSWRVTTNYNLQLDKPGRYEVKLDYSRKWGRWASNVEVLHSHW